MKTKDIIKKALVVLLGVAASGCVDDLNKPPRGVYTDEVINGGSNGDGDIKYTTKAEAETLVRTCYEALRSEFFQFDQFQIQETMSDNAYAGGNDLPTIQLDYFTYDATNSVVKRDWAYMYGAIAKTNEAIQYIPVIPDPALTEVEKKRMVGEALFFRAYFYYIMTNLWGDVPLVLKVAPTITSENIEEVYPLLFPAKAPQAEVYAQIEKDLLEALSSVTSADPNSPDKFLVTQGTVNALLAKHYVTVGNYSGAIQASQRVIDAGYDLLPDFTSLWDLSNEHSKESLLEVDYTPSAGNWTEWILFDYEKTSQGVLDWQRFCTPSHALINNYMEEGDQKRLAETVYTGTVSWNVHWPSNNYKFPFRIRNKANNMILLRFADVLLIKAEAHARLGQLSEAMSLVNKVRGRVGLTDKSASSVDQALRAVYRERQLELAFEGHRWFDLLRSGKTIEVMDKVVDKTGMTVYKGKLAPFRLLLPIPQGELDKNVNMVQNTGY